MCRRRMPGRILPPTVTASNVLRVYAAGAVIASATVPGTISTAQPGAEHRQRQQQQPRHGLGQIDRSAYHQGCRAVCRRVHAADCAVSGRGGACGAAIRRDGQQRVSRGAADFGGGDGRLYDRPHRALCRGGGCAVFPDNGAVPGGARDGAAAADGVSRVLRGHQSALEGLGN